MTRAALLLALGLVVGATAAVAFQMATQNQRRTRAGAAGELQRPARRAVVGQGTLQPRLGPVSIGSPLAGFQIENLAVKMGDTVAAEALLVELDSAAAKLDLEMAQAQKKEAVQRQQTETELAEQRLEAAQLAVRQAEESREVELGAQQKQLEVANLKLSQAEADLQQLSSLSGGADPIVSEQKVKQQKLLRELSLAERDAAEVARKRGEQSLRFQSQQTAAEERAATRALRLAKLGTPLELLDARIALADLKIKQTKIHSPLAGTVLNVWAHPGELVTTQPLLEIADLQDLICVVEVDIADVPLLSVGQAAVITSPAFHGDKVSGVIEQIGVGASPPSLRQLDPRQSLDRTVTKARLRIDARDAVRALGGAESSAVVLVGLRVDVEFALPVAE